MERPFALKAGPGLLLILLLFPLLTTAQSLGEIVGNPVVDSLISKMENATNDSLKALYLNQISWRVVNKDIDTAMWYEQEAIDVAHSAGQHTLSLSYRSGLASMLMRNQEYARAGEVLNKALEYAQEHIPGDHLNIGQVYAYMAALKIRNDQHAEALEDLDKSQSMYQQAKYYRGIANGYIYKVDVAVALQDTPRLERYLDSALTMIRTYGRPRDLAIILQQYGDHLRGINKNEDALGYYLEGLEIMEAAKDEYVLAYLYESTGQAYDGLKRFRKAGEYYQKMLQMLPKVNNLDVNKMAYKSVAEHFDMTSSPDSAFKYYKLYMAAKDSVDKRENQDKLNEAIVKYDTEKARWETKEVKKDLEIEKTARQNSRLTLSIVLLVLVLVVVIGALLIQRTRFRHRARVAELQHKLERTKMNPHFLFNTLISIQNMIERGEQDKAVRSLVSFSSLLRTTLESSEKRLIGLDEELKILQSYLALEKSRSGGKFDFEIQVEEDVDLSGWNILGMITQIHAENAILHGFRDIDYPGKLEIHVRERGEEVEIEIRDNGIGREAAGKIRNPAKGQSIGTRVIEKQIEILKQLKYLDIRQIVKDLEDTTGRPLGTEILIKIKEYQ